MVSVPSLNTFKGRLDK